jgi:putative membrane protein
MWCWDQGITGWGIFGIVMMAVFWAVVIALIIWGIKRTDQKTVVVGNTGTPLDIAKERYAKGEISKQEYENIKRDLS